jgi:hypothetical protein
MCWTYWRNNPDRLYFQRRKRWKAGNEMNDRIPGAVLALSEQETGEGGVDIRSTYVNRFAAFKILRWPDSF